MTDGARQIFCQKMNHRMHLEVLMEPYMVVKEYKWKPIMGSNVQEENFHTGVFTLTVII